MRWKEGHFLHVAPQIISRKNLQRLNNTSVMMLRDSPAPVLVLLYIKIMHIMYIILALQLHTEILSLFHLTSMLFAFKHVSLS